MYDNTKIQWTDATWSPVTGCSPVSEGCLNCWASRMAKRLVGRYGYPQDDPFRVTFHPDRLDKPLRWKKPRRVFIVSMGDIFHENVHRDWILQILMVIRKCPQHTFLILTKRPERMRDFFKYWFYDAEPIADMSLQVKPRPENLWLGVTAENQKRADERIPILLQIPAAVRFVSVEPMLGPIDLLSNGYSADHEWEKGVPGGIKWVICGAETGPGARYMNPFWARNLRDQCKTAGIPFFMKQISHKRPIPNELMIREYPP